MTKLLGYARVDYRKQNVLAEIERLRSVGCSRVFIDHGSGKHDHERANLADLLNSVREGDIVVVDQLKSLSRSPIDLLKHIDGLGKRGVHLRSLGEDFDTTMGDGPLIFRIVGVLVASGREQIQERTLAGLEEARAEGRIGGRPRAFGEKQEAMVVKLHAEGESMREIARLLNVSVGTISRTLKRIRAAKEQVPQP